VPDLFLPTDGFFGVLLAMERLINEMHRLINQPAFSGGDSNSIPFAPISFFTRINIHSDQEA
jgi:hypothetical protein